MKRETILTKVRYMELMFGWSSNDYVVSAGAALVLMGLREETADIDVSTDMVGWSRLINLGYKPEVGTQRNIPVPVIVVDDYEVHLDEKMFHKDREVVEGVPILAAKELLAEKKRLGRDKDANDISVLRRYLMRMRKKKAPF